MKAIPKKPNDKWYLLILDLKLFRSDVKIIKYSGRKEFQSLAL